MAYISVQSSRILLAITLFAIGSNGFAQGKIDADKLTFGPDAFPFIWRAYKTATLPALDLRNGPLLSSTVVGGKLSLSLDDFLRLVVENQLDLESQRYAYLIAQTDFLRASSGQAARGISGAPVPSGLFAGAIGAGVGNNANVSAGGTGGTAISAAARQVVIGPRGTFDPTFSANFSFDRVISPLNTLRVAGTPTVTVPSTVLQTRFQQELPTGASYSLSFNLQRQSSTQRFLLYDPAFTSFFSFAAYQPLLNGFGIAINRRFITITQTNQKISQEAYRQQLNNVLSAAANLYWDAAAMQQRVAVATRSVVVAQQLYESSQKQYTAGAIARLDLAQAESQVAANRRDLITAQTNLQMQILRLKSAMSRSITTAIADADIDFSDTLPTPENIIVPVVDTALSMALQNRSAIRQAELAIENQRVARNFTKANVRPTLSIFTQFNSYTLAGGTSPMFRQMIRWQYPEFSAGLSLNITVGNRAAQADDIRARLELQQAELALQQTRSQIQVSVHTSLNALTQYRAQIAAARRAEETSEAAFRGQQIRFANGLATAYQLILSQRDLVASQAALIQTQVNAAKAVIAEQVATGTFLTSHSIDFDKAIHGNLWVGKIRP